MSTRLECTDLSGGRGSATAFRNVDLTVEEGSVLALLGPNGAGKTTLLLTLAGLLPAQGGTISVDGTRLRNGRPAAANAAGVVLVPDNRALFTTLTVEENIRVAARRNGPKPKSLLETFPALEKRWNLPAGALSGGEQQMLVMARALVQQPRVLLIDELSMGLAPLIVEDLFKTVSAIAADHKCAVILVEQHVNLALEVADSAAVLNRGRIVLRGAAEELAASPELLEGAYLGIHQEEVAGASAS
ncbi:branched-chain amino acid transport system ATP-binding protein [Parafrankia irregularis]|uniref:Branched-chain amino acid transport system ATP-binding protein n=1 Tax=Parafrankia irregularis TaxID=795642 RepID=A0A0S4QNZ3_9ACTN|nr:MULTISPECIES: ATP-binding cassette domain-containing protein [Parafrankia]MBE3200604.1 ATP-binding cassette domain-containing protein [Parafrankia sp. CH37]CUU56937.1 branched-chain amino acid transport system ATP-binding protein [Parafrankia irregularis]